MIGSWKRAAAASVLCLGLAAVASAGVAQDRTPGPGGPPPGAGRHGPGQHDGADRQKMFEQMRQRREQRLHDLLQIKPDQDAAFHTFLASIDPPHRDGKDGHRGPGQGRGPGAAPMTTPQRLERLDARIARLQQVAAATKSFYGILSPEQRRAFDALPMRTGRHGHRGRMGGSHHFEGPR
jgi:protein CpxP